MIVSAECVTAKYCKICFAHGARCNSINMTVQMVRTSVHQFFKGERRLPAMRTETATTDNRQAVNVSHRRIVTAIGDSSSQRLALIAATWNF